MVNLVEKDGGNNPYAVVSSTSFDKPFNVIVKYILENDENPKKEKGLINVFATTSIGYKVQHEIERLLGILGLHVNYLPFCSSIEKLRKIPKAEYSLAISQAFADDFMEYLKNEYDIPYLKTRIQLGFRGTDEWFLTVAKFIGKEDIALKYIEEHHKKFFLKVIK